MISKLKIVWAWLKKYALYILIPVGAVIAFVLYRLFVYKPTTVTGVDAGDIKLRTEIDKTRAKIEETRTKAAIEIAIERTKEETVKKELNAAVKIKDPVKRRDALIDLYDRLELGDDEDG